MQAMAESFQSAKAAGLNVVYKFRLTGEGGGTWGVSIAGGKCSVNQGRPPRADTTITMSTEQYLELAAGELDAVDAYNKGQINVSGNLEHARKFIEIFPPWASRVTLDVPPEPSPTPPTPKPAPAGPTLADYAQAMPKGFQPDKAGGMRAIFHFRLIGDGGGTWTVTVADRNCTVVKGEAGAPSATIRMSGADFIKLAQGALNTTHAYNQGTIKISGDLNTAAKIPDIFKPWAEYAGAPTGKEPTPTPTPEPRPTPEPTPTPSPTGPVNPALLNGSFDEYQPFIRDGEAQFWKEPQFPDRHGAHWTFMVISEVERDRVHPMDSETFGRFTQKYFGGGGLDYHVHGRHSQVVTSRYGFDVVFLQTVTAQQGREYKFNGDAVSFYKGTDNPATHGKVFKTVGIDPTGGRDYSSPAVVWGERDGRDHEWRHLVVQTTAKADAITVFIRLENTERDVGMTELNVIHLDNFKIES